MDRLSSIFPTPSEDALSSLGGLNPFKLSFIQSESEYRTTADPQEIAQAVDSFKTARFVRVDVEEVTRLVVDATSKSEGLTGLFETVATMSDHPKFSENVKLCAAAIQCLAPIPASVVVPIEYKPPETSSWYQKRRALEDSLVKNLQKYIRFADHMLRKPPRVENYDAEILKFCAFIDKFDCLVSRFYASNEKLRLLELCDTYERMKLVRLEQKKNRAILRADRAARKAERESIRLQRAQNYPPMDPP